MAIDHLSEIFDVLEVRGQLSGAFAVRGRWVTQAAVTSPLKLSVMVRGRCLLSTDGLAAPLTMEAGDVAILTGRSWLRAEGGTGDEPRASSCPGPATTPCASTARTSPSTTSSSAVTSSSTRPVRHW